MVSHYIVKSGDVKNRWAPVAIDKKEGKEERQ